MGRSMIRLVGAGYRSLETGQIRYGADATPISDPDLWQRSQEWT
jgi:hypothetical protein